MKVVHPGEFGQAVGCDTHRRDRRIARMNIHKNARLTPPGRLLLVQRIEGGTCGLTAAAIAAGISQRQSYRWLARYRSGGVGALAPPAGQTTNCRRGSFVAAGPERLLARAGPQLGTAMLQTPHWHPTSWRHRGLAASAMKLSFGGIDDARQRRYSSFRLVVWGPLSVQPGFLLAAGLLMPHQR